MHTQHHFNILYVEDFYKLNVLKFYILYVYIVICTLYIITLSIRYRRDKEWQCELLSLLVKIKSD